MKKGSFIVLKTGTHPFISMLKLFFQWGIVFDEANPYALADQGAREVAYADKAMIEGEIVKKFPDVVIPEPEQRPAPQPGTSRKKTQPKV
jgi:type IV secretion system protein VirD4